MTSVLETLSLKELYTRKKNLIFQLEKVDEEIKKKILENGDDVHIEISPYKDDIKQPLKKLIIKKNTDNTIETVHENTLQTNNIEPQIIRKITVKIKK